MSASQARPSGRSETGTMGGAAIVTRGHLHIREYAEANPPPSPEQLCGVGLDWSAITIRARGMDVLLVALYLTSGDAKSRENYTKFEQVTRLVKAVGSPFIIIGDFNQTPDQLIEWGVLTPMAGHVLAPRAALTCTSGTGRLIDYVVCSKSLLPVLHLQTEENVPWKPHVGLRLRLNMRPRTLEALFQSRPAPISETCRGERIDDWSRELEKRNQAAKRCRGRTARPSSSCEESPSCVT